MTPQTILEIAITCAKNGAKFLWDERGASRFRIGPKTDLLGLFIPQSIYYATPDIELMTTYELCSKGIWTEDELTVLNKIDHIQAFCDERLWVKELKKLLIEFSDKKS